MAKCEGCDREHHGRDAALCGTCETFRDKAARAVLPSVYTSGGDTHDDIATECYAVADAMLKARRAPIPCRKAVQTSESEARA